MKRSNFLYLLLYRYQVQEQRMLFRLVYNEGLNHANYGWSCSYQTHYMSVNNTNTLEEGISKDVYSDLNGSHIK